MDFSCITLDSTISATNLALGGIDIWLPNANLDADGISSHMRPKQKERNIIVEQVYYAIETNSHLASTLLVLCGDHGMNDAGNHGGSAAGETSPALIFMSPKLQSISTGVSCPLDEPINAFKYYDFVEQTDIAPTLAGLLGFPVPLNNLGVFIPHFLRLWSNGL